MCVSEFACACVSLFMAGWLAVHMNAFSVNCIDISHLYSQEVWFVVIESLTPSISMDGC